MTQLTLQRCKRADSTYLPFQVHLQGPVHHEYHHVDIEHKQPMAPGEVISTPYGPMKLVPAGKGGDDDGGGGKGGKGGGGGGGGGGDDGGGGGGKGGGGGGGGDKGGGGGGKGGGGDGGGGAGGGGAGPAGGAGGGKLSVFGRLYAFS